MVSKKLTIINKQGFHVRPATDFANAMHKYSCDVNIKFGDKVANGKSMMIIVASCMKMGAEIEVVCDGVDEEAALAEAVAMIENGFGED